MTEIFSEHTEKIVTDAEVERHLKGLQEALDDKKALDISVLDLKERSTMADYFVVCSGNSRPHTRAVAEAAYDYVKEHELQVYSMEGKNEGSWVLLDIGFIVIHVMQAEQREFYNLEQLWSHAQQDSQQ